MEERLDMVPADKQIGFFSDAYCVEWSYAKAKMVLNQLAIVLAQKVGQGQYTRSDSVQIARAIMFDSCHDLGGAARPVLTSGDDSQRMNPGVGQALGALQSG